LATSLQKKGEIAVQVSNGQQLGETQLLFNCLIHSQRERDPFEHGQQVIGLLHIKGRTDIVVLRSEYPSPTTILPGHIKYAIEVKLQSVMEQESRKNGGTREAIAQLLALNCANQHSAPPVILTNLVKTHIVFNLKQTSEPREPVTYELVQTKCNDLDQALAVAEEAHRTTRPHAHFGRGPSPKGDSVGSSSSEI